MLVEASTLGRVMSTDLHRILYGFTGIRHCSTMVGFDPIIAHLTV